MIVLGLDTALAACSAAIWADGVVRSRRFAEMRTGHAETLMGFIGEVMADAGADPSALDRIAVTVGPGSFTGSRVGLAAARGMALARGIPCVGITTLAAIAAAVDDAPGDALIAAAIDARRGEIYYQLFETGPVAAGSPAVLGIEEAASDAISRGRPIVIAGSGAALLGPRVPGAILSAAPELPDAGHVARLAAAMANLEDAPPAPFYLRAPDAKLPPPGRFGAPPA
jgi:tRNA threonylcarbamoyladenosine biosynthesis protein TsaB